MSGPTLSQDVIGAIVDLAKVNLFVRPELIATLALFGGAIGRKRSMFRPQRHDGESNDDADRDFKESVQRDGPRRKRARDENDNRKRNARVVIRSLLQTKRDRLLGYSLERGSADYLARGIGKSYRRAIATV